MNGGEGLEHSKGHDDNCATKIRLARRASQEGLGVFVFASGERYVGEWAGDKIHGNGIYKFQGGSAYAVRGCCRCHQQHFVCKLHFTIHFLFVCVLDMLLLLLTAEGAGLMEVREDGWARCVHQRQRQ
jgi:hypothetical protein